MTMNIGPFTVDSNTGLATGEVFGIDFEVAGATGASMKFDLSGAPKTSGHARVVLAPDLMIELKSTDESEAVSFELNGRDFGMLKEGDEVVIEEDGKVTENGMPRNS